MHVYFTHLDLPARDGLCGSPTTHSPTHTTHNTRTRTAQALAFHDSEFRLASASDDMTIKVWDLQAPGKRGKGNASPTITYRGHVAPVLSLALSSSSGLIFSGDSAGNIRTWKLPAADATPKPFDPALTVASLAAHKDAVWGLDCTSDGSKVLSAGADEVANVYTVGGGELVVIATAKGPAPIGCAEFARSDATKFVIGCKSGHGAIHDVLSGELVRTLGADEGQGSAVNCIKTHATLSFVATANEDKTINFYDMSSGDLLHSMTAHQAAVGSIAFDPSGLYMVSGGHDRSVRMWDVGTRTCVYE